MRSILSTAAWGMLISTAIFLLASIGTPAIAHDQTDCTLEGEATCDETETDATEWLACALYVADTCSDHVDPASSSATVNSFKHKRLRENLNTKLVIFRALLERYRSNGVTSRNPAFSPRQ
jgi:hypothetical protein